MSAALCNVLVPAISAYGSSVARTGLRCSGVDFCVEYQAVQRP